MSENYDEAEVRQRIAEQLEVWATERFVGQSAMNDDTLAEFRFAGQMFVNSLLPAGWTCDLDAELDVENDTIRVTRFEVRRKRAAPETEGGSRHGEL